MDILILLAVFVALLALAYVTYRNIQNLDTRLRRLEDILKNAQVVAEPIGSNEQPHEELAHNERFISGFTNVQHSAPVPGWGGERTENAPSVPVHVQKESTEEDGEMIDERDVYVEDEPMDDGLDGDDELETDEDESDGSSGSESEAENEEVHSPIKEVGSVHDEDGLEEELTVDDILRNMESDSHREDASGQVIGEKHDVVHMKVNEIRDLLKNSNVSFPLNAKKADLVRLAQENGL